MSLGDFALESTFDFHFTTRQFSTGAPFTLAGVPVISAYEDNSTTQITAGITLTVDFDTPAVTGLNHVRVVATAANGYEAGKSYSLVITTGTVDSVSVVGEVVGYFTLERGAAFGRLGAPAGASVSADILAIEAQTDDIGAAGAGLTAVPWNAAWDAEVQSEVADALAVYDPPTQTELVAEIDAVQTDVAAVKVDTAAILVDTGTTLQGELDAIEAAVITNAAGVDVAADIIALKAVADAILVDTGTTLDAAIADIPTSTENADALLARDMSLVAAESARSPLNALRFLRNKWSISGTTLTVTEEDDTTTAWTATLTATAGADPITAKDPA